MAARINNKNKIFFTVIVLPPLQLFWRCKIHISIPYIFSRSTHFTASAVTAGRLFLSDISIRFLPAFSVNVPREFHPVYKRLHPICLIEGECIYHRRSDNTASYQFQRFLCLLSGSTLRPGSLVYSANPPSIAAPTYPPKFSHRVSRPLTHHLQWPHVR